MSKKKRSKIMAALLCATTMAAFYTAPQMVYAENLNFTADGTVTTNSAGNTAITDLEGLESITFGVIGAGGDAGVRLYFDGNGQGGLKIDSSFTADRIYLDVADDYGERYTLHNVLGIHRLGTDGNYVTNIETGADGQGGMQVRTNAVSIFGGKAVFDNREGGTISFNMAFDAAQGMTVGTAYSVDRNGNITTTGTINSMTIKDNQVNGVTLFGNEVTANEVTACGYELTQVGRDVADIVSDVEEIAEKTQGIASYDAMTGTTFTGDVRASGDLVTNSGTITDTDGNEFEVAAASEAIKNVGDLTTRMDTAEGEIDTLQGVVGDEEKGLVKDVNDLNTKTTGMSYNESTGTTFAKDVIATDFVIDADTSLKSVAGDLDTAEGKISANETAISGLDGRLGTAETNITNLTSTVEGHTTQIGALDGRLGTAETDITALEIKTHGFSPDGETLEVNTITATTGTIGSAVFNGSSVTGLTAIGTVADTVSVAGTSISNGSFNGVSIADRTGGATINGISIYQDQSTQDYYVGNVNISDLTDGGSGATVVGIVRTENGEGGHITTIEENLKVNTNGEIANHDNSFKVDVNGNVTAADFKVGSNSFNTVVNDLNTLEGVVGNADSGLVKDVDDLQETVGDSTKGLVKDVNDLTGRVDTNESNITSLQNTVGDDTKGLVKGVNDLTGRVTTAEGEIDTLQVNTANLKGTTLTDMTEIETDKITATEGTIGGISFETVSGEKTIGTADDTINLAGNAISKGSFNGVAIGVENGHATFNGVSIYEDNDNDVMVGGINLSDLQNTTINSGTEIKGITRTDNTLDNDTDNDFTTTIEGKLNVSTDGKITQTDGAFAVDAEGTVTGKDFKVGETTLTSVANDVAGLKTATTGMTFTEGKTNFAQEVKANNFVTDSADLNALSETVNKADTGLVAKVGALETKTTDMTYDAGTKTTTFNNNLKANNFEAATGKLGNMAFSGYSLGAVGETITIAGAEITSNSFNKVSIYQQDDDYYLGDVNVSALKSSQETTTDMLRGITYSSNDPNNYTMTFAGMLSVSTSGEYLFKDGNGGEYDLGDLVNTTTITDDQFKDLADAVGALEDKTTGIEFNKETGETTISHMNGTDTDSDGVNDTFTKGDKFFAVNGSGITANGDTFVKGEGGSDGSGSGAGTGTEKSDHFVDGDQTVGGDQYVTGDVNATNGNYTGNVGVGGDVFIDANGDNVLNDGEISLYGVSGKVDSVSEKVDSVSIKVDEVSASVGDVSSVNSNIAGDSNDDGENDLAGAVNNEYEQRVEADNALNERINSIDNRMGELEDRIDKVGAMAAAIANLRTMGYDPTAPTEIAVGIGQYRDETGAALGLFHYPNRDFMLSMSVSTSGDEVMGGIGATWKFGRKSPEKVAAEKAAKAEKAKLQKAEAIKEAARAKKVAEQQHRHAELAAKEAAAK